MMVRLLQFAYVNMTQLRDLFRFELCVSLLMSGSKHNLRVLNELFSSAYTIFALIVSRLAGLRCCTTTCSRTLAYEVGALRCACQAVRRAPRCTMCRPDDAGQTGMQKCYFTSVSGSKIPPHSEHTSPDAAKSYVSRFVNCAGDAHSGSE